MTKLTETGWGYEKKRNGKVVAQFNRGDEFSEANTWEAVLISPVTGEAYMSQRFSSLKSAKKWAKNPN